MHVCLYITGMPGSFEGQKKASDPLGLELENFVNYYVGAGNRTLNL